MYHTLGEVLHEGKQPDEFCVDGDSSRNATGQMLLARNDGGFTVTILALHDRELEVLR